MEKLTKKIAGVTYIDDFLSTSENQFEELDKKINWDTRMKARKTASYGVAYNYSQMSYPFQEMFDELRAFCVEIEKGIGFHPNNCLINLYETGKSRMGFHSDQIDILEKNTGIAILSLGATRILRFRNIENREQKIDFLLPNGSLIYMTQEVQKKWQHAIPKGKVDEPRMSLTFRKMKE